MVHQVAGTETSCYPENFRSLISSKADLESGIKRYYDGSMLIDSRVCMAQTNYFNVWRRKNISNYCVCVSNSRFISAALHVIARQFGLTLR